MKKNLHSFEHFYKMYITIFLFIIMLDYSYNIETEKDSTDYCQFESFHPSCPNSNDVVLITTATYGRMEVGKCISQEEVSGLHGQDPKYLGCFSDVLDFLQAKCSLKRTCEIKIPDAALDQTKPCFPGLKMYLKAEYLCINVVDQDTTCQIQASSSIPKYLTMKGLLNDTGCGNVHRPWILEASRGQKIRTTFIKMRNNLNTNKANLQNNCRFEVGSFVEKAKNGIINKTFCNAGFFLQRISVTSNDILEDKFISSGSIVKLIVKSNDKHFLLNDKDFDDMILLKIEADGCLDIIPPEDTWLKRTGDDIVIGCYSSKQTWYLRCENKKWSGNIGNCSAVQSIRHDQFEYDEKKAKPMVGDIMEKEHQILVIVAIYGVGIVFCSMIICIGAVCLKRFTREELPIDLQDKHQMYYHDVQHSLIGRSLLKTRSSKNNGCVQNDEMNGFPIMDLMNNENKYFVLEGDGYTK